MSRVTNPEKQTTDWSSAFSTFKPALMCLTNVGLSPFWNGARSHSDSSVPPDGPPSQIPWQQTITRWFTELSDSRACSYHQEAALYGDA